MASAQYDLAVFTLARIGSGRNENGTHMSLDVAIFLARTAVDIVCDAGEAPPHLERYITTGQLITQDFPAAKGTVN